ncbi:MAG TPA: FAD-binding oxidoreductase [Ktedonobacterales bacterium]|nr:FAD-binding oxidoreductase [Ktedonobacterales bacterium]
MGSTSFWQAEAQEEADLPRFPALLGETAADVAIVGGGITGCAAALWLARAGARAIVLEARQVAAGASGRNGGFLLAGTAEDYAAAIARYGRERARRIWDFGVRNQRLAADLLGELAGHGWQSGFRRAGSLRIAASAAEFATHEASVPLLREDGWQAELVAQDHLPERIRPFYRGGIYYPGDGEIQPARFVAGLAMLASQAGATIHEQSPVTGVERVAGGGLRVATASGAVSASHILLATNAWLPELAAMHGAEPLAGAITPTRGQMLVTAPIAERLFDCPCYANEGYQYWRQLPDGRLVVGGWRDTSFETELTDDETPGVLVQDQLDAFVHETLALPDVTIERRWAGIMAFSPDGLPLVGALPGVVGVYVSGGYTGHGNASAILSARIAADLMLDRPNADADLFAPARLTEGAPTPQ